ncbi:HAD family hydrolase [Synoicihabitans lomoniglobus]|uniref:HAD family phosphatase n=1 Tax=Synoicihabitans lomoniglobus TaxID=2909285 RepID=A0AAE9ZZ06_9BACT|nr:HAD family phosphatase [Opitutaceae bacterium LMO-M01]WED65273.1 HAD family phosphatase [Opitutaceae bacterium LMO-M01]
MVAALILDFDGLILDTETPLVDAWEAVHAEVGSVFDRGRGEGIIGHVGVAFDPWEGIALDHERSDLEQRFLRHKNRIIVKQPILPGIIDLLDHARDHGIALAVASNSPHVHVDRHLDRLGLIDRFAAIVCREDVPHGKPQPDVYLAALENLGVEAVHAVAFEDSVPGHQAAHAAGLRVAVIPNPCTRAHRFDHAHLQLDALDQLSPTKLLAKF